MRVREVVAKAFNISHSQLWVWGQLNRKPLKRVTKPCEKKILKFNSELMAGVRTGQTFQGL